MKNDLTWLVTVLDESGSMTKIKNDVMGSFNEFIKKQKKVEGKAECFLTKFNSKITKIYDKVDISELPLLSDSNYSPGSLTKLYDAIGYTIADVKSKIKNLEDDEKPSKILFIIITDGQENDSHDFNKDDIFYKIKKREKKGWVFIYLGANQDAMQEGGKIGIGKNKTATWTADTLGVAKAFSAASSYATSYRTAKTSDAIDTLNLENEYNKSI